MKDISDKNLRKKILDMASSKTSSSKTFEKSKKKEEEKDFENFNYNASPYSLQEVFSRLEKKSPAIVRDTSLNDLKQEVENLKKEIRSLKQNQMINNHRISILENDRDIPVSNKEKKAHRKATRFARNFSKRDLKNIKCYKCGRFGHLAANCKADKFTALELDEETQDKLYELLYESDSS